MSSWNPFENLGISLSGQDTQVEERYLSYDLLHKIDLRRRLVCSIIEYLKTSRTKENIWFSLSAILLKVEDGKASQINQEVTKVLERDLQANPRIQVSVSPPLTVYAYRPHFESILHKDALHRFICAHPVVWNADLTDSYVGCGEDIEALLKEKKIYCLLNKDRKRHVLYERKVQYEEPMEDDLKRLWMEISIPSSRTIYLDELREHQLISEKDFACANREHALHFQQTKGLHSHEQELKRRSRNNKNKQEKVEHNLTNKHLLSKPEYKFLT